MLCPILFTIIDIPRTVLLGKEDVVSKVNDKQGMEVNDEVCNNEQYEAANASQNEISICSIDTYPTSYKDLDAFRANVKE